MKTVLVFAERILPSTQTFIPLQVNQLNQLKRYSARYTGLLPPPGRSYPLSGSPTLMCAERTGSARVRRELYRWTGIAPRYHKALRKLAPDLLHAHFAEGGPAALFLSRALKIPLLLHLRGGAEMHSISELRTHLFQWPFVVHRQQLWSRASTFLCVSKFIRERALEAGLPEEKLEVHCAGMDCAAFTPSVPLEEKDSRMVIYVGRLVPYKGCDFLLHAMQAVRSCMPDAHLVVIGDGPFRSELEELNKRLGAGAKFMGEQSQATIREWLEKARVFCAHSLTLAAGMSKAFGNVFTEAQAMGVPVVSFRHGGISETMQDGVTGLLSPERDTERLASHLLFLSDQAFWASAREIGMRWIREHF